MTASMEERASELLKLPDDVLFAHGGCHVFALALRDFSGLPLLWVRGEGGSHDHVACNPGDQQLLDFFGWFSYSEYRREECLEHHKILFIPTTEEEVRKRFISVRGAGYYAHPDFTSRASDRAWKWIERHRSYFDGTIKAKIRGSSRVKIAGDEEIGAIFKSRTKPV